MPDKSHHNNGKGVQSIEPQQSTWFTHWTGTRFESSTHDPSTHHTQTEQDKLQIGIETASDNFGSSKGIKDLELSMSLKKSGTQSFPFFKRGQETGRSLTPNEGQQQTLKPQFSHKKSTTGFNIGSSSEESYIQPHVPEIPSEQVKFHMFFGETRTTNGPDNFSQLKTVFTSKSQLQNTKQQEHNIQSFLKNDPSTSSSPSLIQEQYKHMQKQIRMGFCQEMMNPGAIQSFPNVPHLEGVHSFSRTTHSLLITKQTDVKMYQEKKIFREEMVCNQLKEEEIRKVNCGVPFFGHGQRGVKLQLLDSSDQESQEKVEDLKGGEDGEKNESSADTDTMDMESFKENHLSGVHFSPQNKEITVESNIPNLPSSKQKEKHKKRKIELPDINLELSSLPASSSSIEKQKKQKPEPCTSRTQSLDMNTLHFNLNPTPNSEEYSDTTNHGSEPTNRWINRLKLTNSSGSRSLPTENGKLNKFVTKVTEKAGPSLKVEVGGECSGENNNKEGITLSHSWIQRWSCNQGQKSPVEMERCKLGNCKVGPEEFEKKQFPSIAAMALMGKAMSGFQQCKFQKKESFVVWNTKGFE